MNNTTNSCPYHPGQLGHTHIYTTTSINTTHKCICDMISVVMLYVRILMLICVAPDPAWVPSHWSEEMSERAPGIRRCCGRSWLDRTACSLRLHKQHGITEWAVHSASSPFNCRDAYAGSQQQPRKKRAQLYMTPRLAIAPLVSGIHLDCISQTSRVNSCVRHWAGSVPYFPFFSFPPFLLHLLWWP